MGFQIHDLSLLIFRRRYVKKISKYYYYDGVCRDTIPAVTPASEWSGEFRLSTWPSTVRGRGAGGTVLSFMSSYTRWASTICKARTTEMILSGLCGTKLDQVKTIYCKVFCRFNYQSKFIIYAKWNAGEADEDNGCDGLIRFQSGVNDPQQ